LSSPQNATNPNDRWASITVDQAPGKMGVVIAGQVLITDLRASMPAYVDEELSMPEMEGSSKLTAVTDQVEGPPLVAITNLSSKPQHVSLTCLHNANLVSASRVEIAAHATAKTIACSSGSFSDLDAYMATVDKAHGQGVYGIQLEGDGLPGSLAAFALAPHFRGHDLIFSSVPFYDPLLIHSSNFVFAGVPIGPQPTLPYGVYVPRLSYANFSDSPIHLSVYLADTVNQPTSTAGDDAPTPQLQKLKSITVSPRASGEYAFSGVEAQSGLTHSVVVKAESGPGNYQAKLVSRSDGNLYEIELLAKDALDLNNSGIHPWSINGDTESHLILFNHSSTAKKVGFTITSGTASWAHEFMLAASETREISFNDLEKEHIRDDSGRLLPPSAKEGVVDWMSPESGDVTGRLMVTSRTNAMARNFSCGGYKVLCSINFLTYAAAIAEGATDAMYGVADNFCIDSEPLQCSSGTSTTGTANNYWTVGATNIIALSSSSQATVSSPTLTGVSVGNGTASVIATAGGCQSTGGKPAFVGAKLLLVANDCSNTSTTGRMHAGWGTNGGLSGCVLSADVPYLNVLTTGGACVKNPGVFEVYQYQSAGKENYAYPVSSRIADRPDNSCSKFIDGVTDGVVITTVVP
jgi:hypothetical protein